MGNHCDSQHSAAGTWCFEAEIYIPAVYGKGG
jgi:hypothetical protein